LGAGFYEWCLVLPLVVCLEEEQTVRRSAAALVEMPLGVEGKKGEAGDYIIVIYYGIYMPIQKKHHRDRAQLRAGTHDAGENRLLI
jgi:hypothetical protein